MVQISCGESARSNSVPPAAFLWPAENPLRPQLKFFGTRLILVNACALSCCHHPGGEGWAMKQIRLMPSQKLREHAADALRRARRLPIGSDRNDLRQLAIGLRWLARHQLENDTATLSAASILARASANRSSLGGDDSRPL
jgi:hypothetical protein